MSYYLKQKEISLGLQLEKINGTID